MTTRLRHQLRVGLCEWLTLEWAVLALLILLAACGSSSHTPVAEPPGPPVVQPPSQPPPPPHVVVSGVTITVTLAGHPVSYARVILAPGVDAPTDADGVARFRYLDSGAYEVAVRDAPPLAVQVLEPIIEVSPEARTFAVELVADIGDGQLVILGDSDSSEPVDWRTSSVDDHLAGVATLAGWPEYRHTNRAEPCTSVAPTGCEHRAIEQVRDLPADTAIVVTRWGLNDLHYQIGSDTFRSHYADALDEVIARGAVPVVVAIQAEEDPAYRGRRDAYNRALAALAAERGAVGGDPGIAWGVDRELFADDGVHLNDAGTLRVADAVLDGLRRALTVGSLVVEPPPAERPCDARFGERYSLMVSDYGLIGADPSAAADDLAWLASLGVCGARVWADWRWDGHDEGSAYRSDGSPRSEPLGRLSAALDFGASLGMQFDLTFGGDAFDSLDAHARAVRDLAGRVCGHPGVAFADLWNEADSELNRDKARRLVSAAKDACPSLDVTISLSAGASGDPDEVIDGYREIADLIDFAAPHWPRVDGWWTRSVPYSLDLQSATGLRPALQEEGRQGYQGQSWPLEGYVAVERDACAADLLLYTQHTDAGYQPWLGSLRERLDPVTRKALETEGASGCP